MHRQLGFLFYLVRVHLLPWRGCSVGSFQLDFRQQPLDLAGVGFIFYALRRPPYDPVEHRSFFLVALHRAKPAPLAELVYLFHLLLEPIELRLRAGGDEIVTVHAGDEAALPVIEETRARCALNEALSLIHI